MSIANVARFLGAPEDRVSELLNEGRLGGVLVAALRNKGVPVTPRLRNSVEGIVSSLDSKTDRRENYSQRLRLMASESTVTIMFTDVVESTAMIERLGDRNAREVFRAHNEIIRRNTRTNGGHEIKSMGDGFMLTFTSARRAITCAVASQQELRRFNKENPDAALDVRMGMSVGEPVREEEDLFGKSVILAARINAMAEGSQILICQIVHALASSAGEFRFNELGQFELKGIARPQTLYEVIWR